mmetsp:Transcript_12806/g.36162  ORF Transcript_12806/g.36162 Transcript_12806/m.36162 type:complete len:476 (-) Transcript_12806:235-1662(-)
MLGNQLVLVYTNTIFRDCFFSSYLVIMLHSPTFVFDRLFASSHSRNFSRKIIDLLFNTFSDNQSGEANHLGTVLLEELLHSNVTILDVGLRNKAFVLEVFSNSSLDHFFDNLGRLSTLKSLFRKNSLLVVEDILWHIVSSCERWVHGSNVHGNIRAQLSRSSLKFDKDTDGSHVDISTDSGGSITTSFHSSDLDVFSNLGNKSLSSGLKALSVNLLSHQVFNTARSHGSGGSCNAVAVCQECGVLSDEISLAVDFNHNGLAITSSADRNLTLSSNTGSLLVGLGQSLLAQEFSGNLLVTSRFGQGLLAVHHTGTGEVTKGLDGLGCDSSSGGGRSLGSRSFRSWFRGSCLGRSSTSGFARSEGCDSSGLVSVAALLARSLVGSEFFGGGLEGSFLGGLVGGSSNGFLGFAFLLGICFSEGRVDLDLVSCSLLSDLAGQDLSKLPVGLLDKLGGGITQQLLFDYFFGRVSVDDLAD